MRYAIIDQGGNVLNVIELDDVENYRAPEGATVRAADSLAEPGGKFASGKFQPAPRPAPPPDPRPEPMRNIERIETENPVTQRALRELILTIGEIYPAGKETLLYTRVFAVETAIRAERARL